MKITQDDLDTLTSLVTKYGRDPIEIAMDMIEDNLEAMRGEDSEAAIARHCEADEINR
jgi:hypothetical protein